ncbi:MAG: DUF6445 family protein [Litorimonas sp.]
MFEIKYVGHSKEPIVIMDDFHPDLSELRATVANAVFGRHAEFYPGIQSPANPTHLQPVAERLTKALKDVFAVQHGVSLVQCSYSLVTTAETDLTPIQRLPHVDTTDPGRFALLHYLSGPEQGGTAFYRHRSTELEVLTAETYPEYKAGLQKEGVPKPGYMRGSDDRFEMIMKVEAIPNRAVLYRSALLHSGFIPKTAGLSKNPLQGRLTINSFFQAKTTKAYQSEVD